MSDGNKIADAKEGVVEFLRNCTQNATAIAIHLLNPEGEREYDYDSSSYKYLPLPTAIENATLTSDIVLLASEITEPSVQPTGGTPLYETIAKALAATPRATRLVAFSDGQPGGCYEKERILKSAKNAGIPIDTVFIADKNELYGRNLSAISEMKYIAEMTGGIFLDLSKGDIKSGLKYLAPAKRLMLMDSSFKAKVERGEA
jgi:hypothetical protein